MQYPLFTRAEVVSSNDQLETSLPWEATSAVAQSLECDGPSRVSTGWRPIARPSWRNWRRSVWNRSSTSVHDGVDEQAFVALRTKRDGTLAAPVLLLPSVQVNIRAGNLPPPEANGVTYLKIPVRQDP